MDRKKWYFDFYNQWRGIFRRPNWYDFTIIQLAFEYAPYKVSWEVEFRLLGVGFCLTRTLEDREDYSDIFGQPPSGSGEPPTSA